MDKFEYKIKADEIKELIAQKEYEQAAEIADSIDWRRIKSVMMLCTVSDLYKMCRRYEDSRDLLLLAYDRHPGGRMIVYSLCELSIKMEEFVQAVEYYKEYVQIAPKDTGRYILQYKLYEAQDVSLEERIAVLEELKKKEYREKWAYELAYLYHRVGLATKCVEECDEIFLWFGEGRYVIKALELKALHAPLTAEQKYKYDSRFGATPLEEAHEEEKEVSTDTMVLPQVSVSGGSDEPKKELSSDAPTTRIPAEEIEIQVKTLDVGKYDTINLQEELAAGIQEYFGNTGNAEITRSIMAPMFATVAMEQVDVPEAAPQVQEPEQAAEEEKSEVFFGATEELSAVEAPAEAEQISLSIIEEQDQANIGAAVMQQMKSAEEKNMQQTQPPKEIAKVLSMEGDGQISFVLPERDPVEKQITGQISIDDIILEWERLKKENEEKRKEEIRQHVLQQTGPMFTEFDAAVRDGLLEKLEKGEQQDRKPIVKLADMKPAEVPEEQGPAEAPEEQSPAEEEALTVSDIGEVEELEEIQEVVPVVEEELVAEEVLVAEEEPAVEETPAIVEEPSQEDKKEVIRDKHKVRNLTREERELFGSYIQGKSMKEQLINAIDGISMASYTGNVIVTGAEGMDSIGLAKNMVREVQMTDHNMTGKIAKISGDSLNSRNVKEIIDDLRNGALIIQKASKMQESAANDLYKALQKEDFGIVVVMEDTKRMMDRFLQTNASLASCFTARVDVAALSNQALAAFAKKYAREREYSIDELGLLALHTRIEDMQTSDHAVTVMDVKEIMDEAIESAERKTIGHFFDIILGKRYDEEDMIILKEKDFM